MISHFFIRRPIFASVVSIVIVLAGLVAIRNLPVAQYPEISPPQVTVTSLFPGATAESLQETVAAPLEEQINGVEDMLYMSSVSSSNGTVTTTITFEIGTDIDLAANDVSNRVRLAEPRLPEEVRRNGVTVQKRSLDFLQIAALSSPDGRYDPVFLSNYATLNIVDSLKRVPGVGDVLIFGAKEYSMRIWLRPDRMAQLGLTTGDVAAAVREQNAQFAVGKVGQEPSDGSAELTYTVTTEGRLADAEQFGEILLRADPNGRQLRLKDVARIELGARDYGTESRLNGKPTTNIAVFLQPGANALATAEGVNAELDRLAELFPAGVEIKVPFDTTRFVEASIKEVLKTLGEAMILVFLVVYLFLGKFRATLIPTLAVPVSLIGTFAGMWALGFSINTLTLFGLVLAIGIVVDDAIVVLENVERIMVQEGKGPREAAFQAMTEVTGPVIAIVLVLVSVFVPVAFLGGLAGQLYRQFAITIAISVTISGVVALTLTPALCALLLRPGEIEPRGALGAFHRFFDRFTNAIVGGVGLVLRARVVAFGLLLLLGLAIWGLFQVVPGGLVPAEDQGYFLGEALLPDGATLGRTLAVTEKVESILLAETTVADVVTLPGVDFIGGGSKSSVMTFFVILKKWDERSGPGEDVNAVIGRFLGATAAIREAFVIAFNPPAIRGLGTTGGFEVYLQNRGGGGTLRLAEVTQEFLGALAGDPRLAGAQTLFRANEPQLHVELDREKAKAAGVDVDEVFSTLQATFGQLYVNDFNKSGRTFRVQLQAEAEFRSRPDDLKRVYVRSAAGSMIPLASLLEITYDAGAEVLERYNGFPAVKILGAGAPGVSSGEAIRAVEDVAARRLPEDFTIAWTGSAFQEERTGGSSRQVFVFGVIFVFLILAAQYERWSLPLAVIMAVPFAVLGALTAIWLRGLANDVYFQIGLVTLVGLAAKNAILIVEFATLRHDAGRSVREAALEAARLRFRPIVMTSLAFILGVLPLAVSTGAGAGGRHSIGTGVLGGMLVATFLAVFFVPLFFELLTGRRGRDPAAASPPATATPAAPTLPEEA